jgi:hypothetical protein
MRSIFGNLPIFKAVFLVTCLLVSASAWCQVAPNSGDVSFSVGYDHVGTGPNNNFASNSGNSVVFGGNGGVNVNRYIEAGGEFNYFNDPQPSVSGVNVGMRILNYGGLVRLNLAPKGRIVPYGVFGIGGSHAAAAAAFCAVDGCASVSIGESGYYLGGGGGLSYYAGPKWGVRAEFRDNWNHFSYNGSPDSTDALAVTGGLFFQFGGTATTLARR